MKNKMEIETKILQLMDECVRPLLQRDGGDFEFVGFDEGVVSLRLKGACGSCPSSIITLKHGIENLLKEEFPEVKEVRQV